LVFGCSTIAIAIKGMYAYEYTYPLLCMKNNDAFLYKNLTAYDQILFVRAFQTALEHFGKESCWCLTKMNNAGFKGFTTSKKTKLMYKGHDARPLILGMTGRNYSEENPIIVKKSECKSQYCLNPSHYYWGTRKDVAYENAKTSEKSIDVDLITKLRTESNSGVSSRKLSKHYRLPYHSVRRICSGETYENAEDKEDQYNEEKVWSNLSDICINLMRAHPNEAKNFRGVVTETQYYECPWHIQGTNKHKGNFGLMGECLDCMEEIKKSRCTVDVREFEMKWYWQVKRFWEQVDIKGEDECWEWKGATRKNGTESTAYFPSPFHSGKTQSAPRIAFWLSRGYTGKYRIFNQPECKTFCCNPKHLMIKGLREIPQCKAIKDIKLHHENILQYHRERNKQN